MNQKRGDSERGAVMVIVAFFIVAALGFTSLAVDGGGWMVSQRSNQNAADAAAYAAVYARGIKGKSKSEAKKIAYKAAVNNTSDALDPEQVSIRWDGWNSMTSPKATVTVFTKSQNYYSTAQSHESTTNVGASATAQLYSEPAVNTAVAIDAAKGIQLSDGGNQDLTGNLQSGGDVLITNYAVIEGDIVTDGNVHLNSGKAFTLNGGVDAGGNILVNTPMKINGAMSSGGTFEWNSNDGGQVNGDVTAGKNIRNLQGVRVAGKTKQNVKVEHTSYTWRWESLDDEFVAYQQGQPSYDVAEITKDLVNEFNEENRYKVAGSSQYWNGMTNVVQYGDWNKGLTIVNTASVDGGKIGADEFFNFVAEKTGKNKLFIPGTFTMQCNDDEMTFNGTICAGEGINLQSGSMTVNGNTTFMSLKGGFVNNSTGIGFILHGSIVNMDPEREVSMKADGAKMRVYGSIISKGKMLSNSPLAIVPRGSDASLQKTRRYVNLTNK